MDEEYRIQGLVAAVFTPLKKNGDVNLDLIPKYAKDHLKSRGVSSVFVNGTTGEGPSLTTSERKSVAEAWMDHQKHGLQNVVVHVGGANLRESQELAEHAGVLGADAIGLMPPTFFKPATLELLVSYCAEVACKAPKTPFYYYHIPALTGVNFDMLRMMKVMEEQVPTLRGIKYSNRNLTELSMCRNYNSRKYNMLFGVDEDLLGALSMGVDSAIGSTYNFMAPIYHNMIKAFEAGDMKTAAAQQLKSQQVLQVVFSHGSGVAVLKEVMSLCSGLDLGPSRLPLLQSLLPEVRQKMKTELEELGLFKWITEQ